MLGYKVLGKRPGQFPGSIVVSVNWYKDGELVLVDSLSMPPKEDGSLHTEQEIAELVLSRAEAYVIPTYEPEDEPEPLIASGTVAGLRAGHPLDHAVHGADEGAPGQG